MDDSRLQMDSQAQAGWLGLRVSSRLSYSTSKNTLKDFYFANTMTLLHTTYMYLHQNGQTELEYRHTCIRWVQWSSGRVVAEGAGSTLTLSTASNFEQVANYSASYPQWDGK